MTQIDSQQEPVKRGRPRSEAAREAILSAALRLGVEQGLRQVTIDAIAHEAGVGKQTIYRWWSNKYDVLIEALLAFANEVLDVPQTGDLLVDLKELILRMGQALESPASTLFFELIAYCRDSEDHRDLLVEFVTQRRQTLRETLPEAPWDDEFFDMIVGSVYYRELFGHAPVNEAFADQLTAHAARLM